MAPLASTGIDTCPRSDTSASLQAVSAGAVQAPVETDLHRFSDQHGEGVSLSECGRMAARCKKFNSSIVYSATPLVQDELYEVSVVALWRHLAGTLCVGVTAQPPSNCSNTMPADCCYLTGNELRYKNKVLQFFAPNLQWLNVQDRVGMLRTHDGTIKVFVNGEELPVSFPPLPEMVYAVFDLRGACSEIAVTSHKCPMSPMNSIRLQDSLELVIDQANELLDAENRESVAEDMALSVATNGDVVYEFHENHGTLLIYYIYTLFLNQFLFTGRNIELVNGKNGAKRLASYNQGVVVVQPALEPNCKVLILIEQLEAKWQSSLIVGLVAGSPERLNLPVNALSIKGSGCIVANDWISINGIKVYIDFIKKYVGILFHTAVRKKNSLNSENC